MLSRRDFFGATVASSSLYAASPAHAGQRLSQADLADIARRHGLWLQGMPGGAFADLRGADLAGLCLDGIDLSEADLSGANLSSAHGQGFIGMRGLLIGTGLSEVRLAAPILDGAIFDRADLRDAWLADWQGPPAHPRLGVQADSRASLLGARFHLTDLSGARINAYLAGTSFLGANLAGANLSLCLGGADFRRANLVGAALDNCEFKTVDFRGAELQGCSFRGTTALRGEALPAEIHLAV